MDIDTFWEYGDPAASEERFRTALTTLHKALSNDVRLELRTQIARTYSLRRRFAEAHAELDAIEMQLEQSGPRPRIRYWLERGRTFNSAGESAEARACFVTAWTLGQESQQEGLAVDAAHMVAITYAGTAKAIHWAEKGLALAQHSTDAKARALISAMRNNGAWELHDRGEFAAALDWFQQAQIAWEATGQPRPIQIAKWSVARCLRSLNRHREALDILYLLEKELQAQGMVDGYVIEEIGENLYATGQYDAAKPYFQQAVAELEQDQWLVEHEPARLAQLRARA